MVDEYTPTSCKKEGVIPLLNETIVTDKTLLPLSTADISVITQSQNYCSPYTKQNTNEQYYYPYCSISNFGTTKVLSDSSKCKSSKCPTGFVQQMDTVTCTKPVTNAVIDSQKRCSERITDWYSIPNFHIGNKFTMVKADGKLYDPNVDNELVNAKCYAPCNEKQVPIDSTTPAQIELNKCALKEEYLGGTYANTSSYCPISWIKRISSSANDIETDLRNNLKSVGCDSQTKFFNDVVKGYGSDAKRIADSINKLENVKGLTNTQMLNKCTDSNFATPDRIAETYAICTKLKNDPDSFEAKFREEMGDDERTVDNKITMLRQACNATFSGEGFNKINIHNITPITFSKEEIADRNMSNIVESDESDEDGDGDTKLQEGEKSMNNMVSGTLAFVITVLTFVILIATCIFLWFYVINPYILPFIKDIIWDRFFTGIITIVGNFFKR